MLLLSLPIDGIHHKTEMFPLSNQLNSFAGESDFPNLSPSLLVEDDEWHMFI